MGYVTGIVLPLSLSYDSYGYYKLFGLYLLYVGVFHFGFIDGIFLKYAGIDYNDLNKKNFSKYFRFLLILQITMTLLVCLASIIFLDGDRRLVFVLVSLNVMPWNLLTYFQMISQITSRFKEYSLRNILYSILSMIFMITLVLIGDKNYLHYIIVQIVVNIILVIYYLFTYKDITMHKSKVDKTSIVSYQESMAESDKTSIRSIFKLGIPLLLSNLVVVLIVNLPKQVVDIAFSVKDFAIFAFAFSLLSFITLFINAMSTVLYPSLMRSSESRRDDLYTPLSNGLSMLSIAALMGYFVLKIIVINYIPKYEDSIETLLFLFPSVMIISQIQIIKQNYFKSKLNNKEFMWITLFFTIISIVIYTFIVVFSMGNLELITIIYVFILYVWDCFCGRFLEKKYTLKYLRSNVANLVGIITFYLVSTMFETIVAMIIFGITIIIIYLIFFREELKIIYNKILSIMTKK